MSGNDITCRDTTWIVSDSRDRTLSEDELRALKNTSLIAHSVAEPALSSRFSFAGLTACSSQARNSGNQSAALKTAPLGRAILGGRGRRLTLYSYSCRPTFRTDYPLGEACYI
jgi:hypothetical protein